MNMTIATFARHAPRDYADGLVSEDAEWLDIRPSAPGSRPYHLKLVDDLGPLLPRDDATAFGAWPERIAPDAIPDELRELARQAEMALTHPAISDDCRLSLIADHLRALADRTAR